MQFRAAVHETEGKGLDAVSKLLIRIRLERSNINLSSIKGRGVLNFGSLASIIQFWTRSVMKCG
jgi:hypothetical protein